MTAKPKAPEPPLGVVGALVAGFETVNARLELILLPLILDLFLWLGPHLSIKPLMDDFVEQLGLLLRRGAADAATIRSFNLMYDALTAYGKTFNLFSLLSTAPLGLPSLMAGRAPLEIPGGTPLVWPLQNPFICLLLTVVFVLGGLFLGALYLGGVAQQVRDERLSLGRLLRQVWGDWLQMVVLVGLWLFLLVALGSPLLLLAGLLALINPVIGSVFWLLGSMLGVWALIYMGFTLHGIVFQRRNLFLALWDSVRLVHRNLPPTASLFAVILLTSAGLGFLWNIPTDNSWLLLVGLGGHALVSTALVAATFTFYKDRYRWWQEMSQWVQAEQSKATSR